MNFLKQHAIWLLLCLLSLGQLSKLFLTSDTDQPKDFRQVFLSSKLISQNKQPYNDSLIKDLWKTKSQNEQIQTNTLPGSPYNRSVYPPHFLRMIQPLSATSWSTAKRIWWGIILCSFIGLVFVMPNLKWWQALLLLLSFKASVPSLIFGQPVWLFAFSLALFLRAQANENKALAFLSFLGMSLKISLMFPVLLWLVFQRKWKMLGVAMFAGFIVLASLLLTEGKGLGSLLLSWAEQMSLQWQSAYDGKADNAIVYNLTELGVLFDQIDFWKHPTSNYVLFSLGLLTHRWFQYRYKIEEGPMLLLLFLIQFICGYHLIYDLIVLIPILAYGRVRISPVMLVFALPLVLPINALLPDASLLKLHLPALLVCLMVVFMVFFARKHHDFGAR